MYSCEKGEAGADGRNWTLRHYLHRGSSGVKQAFRLGHYRPNFFTRRLCGYWSYVHVQYPAVPLLMTRTRVRYLVVWNRSVDGVLRHFSIIPYPRMLSKNT